MRIAGTGLPAATPATPVSETTASDAAGPASGAAASAPAAGPLQSAVMKPALDALRAMPEIDHAKVAELRDALARGEVPFDASKLAGLVARFHSGRS